MGQVFGAHKVTLGGAPSTVALRVFKTTDPNKEGFTAAQLVVFKHSGDRKTLVFEGPRNESLDKEPFRFVQGPAGNERIDMVGDIDGDGSSELVSARMQSDVRPQTWRVYRWTGPVFSFVRSGQLVGSADDKVYTWHTGKHLALTNRTWVSRFVRSLGKGQVEVELASYDGHETSKAGRAILQATGDKGYRVWQWLQPMHKLR